MPLCRAVQRASPGSLRHANPPRSKKARNHERTHTSLAHNCERRSYSHAAPPTQAHTSLPPSPPIVFHHTPRHPQPLVHLSPKDREQCLSAFICLAHTHTHTDTSWLGNHRYISCCQKQHTHAPNNTSCWKVSNSAIQVEQHLQSTYRAAHGRLPLLNRLRTRTQTGQQGT